MKTMKFKLSGLHCASCKGLIEDVVRDVPDVQSAQVDSEASSLTIEHGASFEPQTLMDEVVGLGAGYAIEKL